MARYNLSMKHSLQLLGLMLALLGATASSAQIDMEPDNRGSAASQESVLGERSVNASGNGLTAADPSTGLGEDRDSANDAGPSKDAGSENILTTTDEEEQLAADSANAPITAAPDQQGHQPSSKTGPLSEAEQLSQDWGDWAGEDVTITHRDEQTNADRTFGVGIEGEDELLLNRLDRSVISEIGFPTPDP